MILRVPGDALLLRTALMERHHLRTRSSQVLSRSQYDCDRDSLTFERGRLSKKAQFVLRSFTSCLMQIGTIECLYESGGQGRSLDRIRTDPLHRQKMTDEGWRVRRNLPISER